MSNQRTYIVAAVVLVLIAYVEFRFEIVGINKSLYRESSCDGSGSGPLGTTTVVGGGSATSGRLFKGEKTRTFQRSELQFSIKSRDIKVIGSSSPFKGDALKCDKWSVVTTIFEPSDAVKKQALVPGWCLVVVGDKKGPLKYDIDAPHKNFVFLTAAMQEDLARYFPLVGVTPWNHFGRKNIGYLYAILHGASVVWDFDDDNALLFSNMPSGGNGNGTGTGTATIAALDAVGYEAHGVLSFNPYPLMGAPNAPCWPRGLPLQDIKFNASQVTLQRKNIPVASVGIIQSLANHDPDVDAIYRLTQPLPFDFPTRGLNVSVPRGAYAPYNAQATLHMYPALWSLLLPVTVHGRVSDIWRGYAAQRLMDMLGLRLLFSPALVRQDRNVHNYLADFDSEGDLYLRAMRLLEQLRDWSPSDDALKAPHPLAACMEELWVMMYEHGYFQIGDVKLVQAWLHSLVVAGYAFPAVIPGGGSPRPAVAATAGDAPGANSTGAAAAHSVSVPVATTTAAPVAVAQANATGAANSTRRR